MERKGQQIKKSLGFKMCAWLEEVTMLCSLDWNNDCRPCLSLTPAITTFVLWHDQESTGKSKNGSLLLKDFGRLCWLRKPGGVGLTNGPFSEDLGCWKMEGRGVGAQIVSGWSLEQTGGQWAECLSQLFYPYVGNWVRCKIEVRGPGSSRCLSSTLSLFLLNLLFSRRQIVELGRMVIAHPILTLMLRCHMSLFLVPKSSEPRSLGPTPLRVESEELGPAFYHFLCVWLWASPWIVLSLCFLICKLRTILMLTLKTVARFGVQIF